MKTYGQFCPVAQALEILAERWTLLVVRELLSGSRRFSDIQRGVPLMSRTLLSQRLKTLQECALVQRVVSDKGPSYELTESGAALNDLILRLGEWGSRYAHRAIPDHHLDPKLLMWDMRRRINLERIPDGRTVVLFRFSDAKAGEQRFWLHFQRDEVDVCMVPAGFTEDLIVDTDVRTLTEIWMGQLGWGQALSQGTVRVKGAAKLRQALPGWLMLNLFADARASQTQPHRQSFKG